MSEPKPARLVDCTGTTTVLARADPRSRFAARMDVPLGRAVRDTTGCLVTHTTPDTWTVLAPDHTASQLMARLEPLVAGEFVSLADLTHAYALVRLSGAIAAQALGTVCAIDLSTTATPDGTAFRTTVAGITAAVIRDDEQAVVSYLLQCERSFGGYLKDTLTDAAGV